MAQELTETMGIVLKSEPFGEYDRRLVILTKDMGKITAFARAARRTNSKLLAKTNVFCFGTFYLYPTRTAYTLTDAQISAYFDELSADVEAACYGTFFLELADYYAQENLEAHDLLLLLYLSLKALSKKTLSKELVRIIFENRALKTNGEFPGTPEGMSEGAKMAVSHMVNAPFEKLFTFTVSDEVLRELSDMTTHYRNRFVGRSFHSLEILKTLQGLS